MKNKDYLRKKVISDIEKRTGCSFITHLKPGSAYLYRSYNGPVYRIVIKNNGDSINVLCISTDFSGLRYDTVNNKTYLKDSIRIIYESKT